MINLLPSSIKEQKRYAGYNRLVLRYLRLLAVVAVLLGGVFGASIYFLDQQAKVISADVAEKQRQIDAYAADVKQAKDVADRLTAIKSVQASQTKFSKLLTDLANTVPGGVSITGSTYESMLSFREALAGSARISGVDLENVNQTGAGSYQSSVVMGFKPGQAR
jgi:Tfp pilus assembly protein PilN